MPVIHPEFANLREVFVNSYPKSGSTWLRRLLANTLGCAVGNFYDDDPPQFHGPVDPENRLIIRKLHYSPGLAMHAGLEAEVTQRLRDGYHVFLQRDPRSVAISLYHYSSSMRGGRDLASFLRARFPDYVSWVRFGLERADLVLKYERLLDPGNRVVYLREACEQIVGRSVDAALVQGAFDTLEFAKLQQQDPHFFWKGKADSWKEHMSQEHGRIMHDLLFDFMLEQGYEKDLAWWQHLPLKAQPIPCA